MLREFKWPTDIEDSYAYSIIDDDFVVKTVSLFQNGMQFGAVIDVYEAKGLPVAPNLLIAMQLSEQMGQDIPFSIWWCEKHCPKFAQYKDELIKLMVLL